MCVADLNAALLMADWDRFWMLAPAFLKKNVDFLCACLFLCERGNVICGKVKGDLVPLQGEVYTLQFSLKNH